MFFSEADPHRRSQHTDRSYEPKVLSLNMSGRHLRTLSPHHHETKAEAGANPMAKKTRHKLQALLYDILPWRKAVRESAARSVDQKQTVGHVIQPRDPILHADSTCSHATAVLTTTRLCGCRQELGKMTAFITRTVLVGLITVQLRRQRGELHSSSFLLCLHSPVSPSVCLRK